MRHLRTEGVDFYLFTSWAVLVGELAAEQLDIIGLGNLVGQAPGEYLVLGRDYRLLTHWLAKFESQVLAASLVGDDLVPPVPHEP